MVPGGPDQYCAVHQYSVVRRVWGASGVYKFLIFAPPTPPQNLIAEILSTHVRCSVDSVTVHHGHPALSLDFIDYPRRGVSVRESPDLLISRKQHSMLGGTIKYP